MRRIESLANFRRFWYSAATLMGLASSTGYAQQYWNRNCPQPCDTPRITGVAPAQTPAYTAQPAPNAQPAPAATSMPTTALTAPSSEFGALGGATAALAQSGVAYIDSAIPWTGVRLRYDNARDSNRPDRGEYFYGKCGCFAGLGVDLKATGPGVSSFAKSVDYQEFNLYAEAKVGERGSVFVDTPFRWVSFTPNDGGVDIHNGSGLSDISIGFKYVLGSDECQYLTFQLRSTLPSGDASEGLGTANYNVEPALLYFRKLSDKVTLEAELRDWVAIGGSDFAGNVIRYGVGLSFEAYKNCNMSIRPVAEFVGWTFTSGQEISQAPNAAGFIISDASGDTIINGKFGVRANFGDNSSFYAGYGRALTGEVLYKHIFRVEYRYSF